MENGKQPKSKGTRKPNFSGDETRVLLDSYEEYKDIIEGKFSNSISKINKNEAWEKITSNVNALGVAPRTIEGIQTKFKNLKSDAKLAHNSYKRKMNGTGGGPPPEEPNQLDKRVANLFEGRPSFEGLDGFSTNLNSTGESFILLTKWIF